MRASFIAVVSAVVLATACSGGARVVAPVAPSAVGAKQGDGAAEKCPPPRLTTMEGCARAPTAGEDPQVRGALLAARSVVHDSVREAAVMSVIFAAGPGWADDEARNAAIDASVMAAVAVVDERARCLDVGLASHARLDADTMFFSGSIPTDAGRVGDMPTWGVLVVRVACEWKMVDLKLTGSEIARYRSPAGDALFMQTNVSDQCSATTRVFTAHAARAEVVASFVGPRSDMGGVCNEQLRVELDIDGDVLRGYRLLERQGEGEGADAWATKERGVWRDGRYVVAAPTP